jgi:hypothetical protein
LLISSHPDALYGLRCLIISVMSVQLINCI